MSDSFDQRSPISARDLLAYGFSKAAALPLPGVSPREIRVALHPRCREKDASEEEFRDITGPSRRLIERPGAATPAARRRGDRWSDTGVEVEVGSRSV